MNNRDVLNRLMMQGDVTPEQMFWVLVRHLLPRLQAAFVAPVDGPEQVGLFLLGNGRDEHGGVNHVLLPLAAMVTATIGILEAEHPDDIREANLEKASLAMALRLAADRLEHSMASVSVVARNQGPKAH